jgi:hypothetical protein
MYKGLEMGTFVNCSKNNLETKKAAVEWLGEGSERR